MTFDENPCCLYACVHACMPACLCACVPVSLSGAMHVCTRACRYLAQRESKERYPKQAVDANKDRVIRREDALCIDWGGSQTTCGESRDGEMSCGHPIPSLLEPPPRYPHGEPQAEDQVNAVLPNGA